MPHSYLKVVGNLGYRCNNSSPRYMRENHYAILVSNLKISYVFKYKISITLRILFVCCQIALSLSDNKYSEKCLHSDCWCQNILWWEDKSEYMSIGFIRNFCKIAV